MREGHLSEGDPRVQQALEELRETIRRRWPSATFEVSRGEDDPESIHLNTTVDIEDPDEVGDLVIDRLLELQTDKGLPIHVISLRPVERVIEELRNDKISGRRRHSDQAAVK
jgi:hypothetical protein